MHIFFLFEIRKTTEVLNRIKGGTIFKENKEGTIKNIISQGMHYVQHYNPARHLPFSIFSSTAPTKNAKC